jgi:transposase-like protein
MAARKRTKSAPPPGRPSQLKDPAREAIIKAVRIGCPYKHAARAARISTQTLYSWIRQARADRREKKQSPFTLFLDDLEEAESKLIIDALSHLRRKWKRSERSITWLLERKEPEEFGDKAAELREIRRLVAEQDKQLEELKAILRQTQVG